MMTLRRLFLTAALGCSLSACASVDIPSRNAPFEALPENYGSVASGYAAIEQASLAIKPHSVTPVIAVDTFDNVNDSGAYTGQIVHPLGSVAGSDMTITKVTVRVPRTLEVSEANRYIPQGDIVWREDPLGNRHAQVQAIVQRALEAGVRPLSGPVKAELDVEVLRFHALTQKARYTTGGLHSIAFTMVLRDAETGAPLTEVREIEADLKAYGGRSALVAIAEGQTQKVRITGFLAKVIQQEILTPGSRAPRRGGLLQALNRL